MSYFDIWCLPLPQFQTHDDDMSIVHLYVSFKNFFAFLRFILEGDAIIFTCPGLKTWWEHHHSRNFQKELMLFRSSTKPSMLVGAFKQEFYFPFHIIYIYGIILLIDELILFKIFRGWLLHHQPDGKWSIYRWFSHWNLHFLGDFPFFGRATNKSSEEQCAVWHGPVGALHGSGLRAGDGDVLGKSRTAWQKGRLVKFSHD